MVERKFMLEATEDFTAVLSHLATQAALGTKVRNKYKVSVDFGMECFKDWPHMVLFPYLSMSDRCKRVRFRVLVLDISWTFRCGEREKERETETERTQQPRLPFTMTLAP